METPGQAGGPSADLAIATSSADLDDDRAKVLATMTFPRSEAENLFSHGYEVISDRYIDKVDLRAVGTAGLRGLSRLDPEINVDRMGSTLEVSRDDKVIGVFPLPMSNDSAGWGLLTANVFGLVRDTSTPLLNADPEALYKAVFDGALAKLDPFSRYADSTEASLNRGARNGFGGIGIMYDIRDGAVIITRVMPGTPASDAGLRSGDRIIAINGQSTKTVSRQDVRNWLRGPTSSDVTLVLAGVDTLARRSVTLDRALIVMPTVDLKMDNDVAFITVTSFNQRTTTAVAEAVSDAEIKGGDRLKGIVLDLRGNPGGLLDQAVTMSDLFMERGPIVSTRGRHPDARQFYAATPGDMARGMPMVVLVDGDSASAAEIVAAALQDSGRAVVIGTTSYGKGTVQTVLQMPNGGEMTLTWSRFHSPSGYVLHGLGVRPVACTSGAGETLGAADGVLDRLNGGERELAAQLALWRATDRRDDARRDALRGGCPAEHHPHALIDETVAEKLLDNHALYERALRLTAPTQAAAGR
ncbi:MAG: PDZ domain-containing protein [Rhodospirillum sp.]|nr:PDZ domain-containing protein [Rhodospirillum sp.]MCF8491539.1 PDZ domain-containing protein [Rhodospirillum sp.]MCF8501694.1 PDZ domain-containing protein [Rhodospirillum sp.]